jgi:hypothetical protein
VVLFSCIALSGPLRENSRAQELRLPFGAGETLRYFVKWGLMPAGNAELTVRPDRSAGLWKVIGTASSVGYVSNIYRVEDRYEASFHNPTFCSQGIHKVIHEGDRSRDVKLEFDSRQRMARLEMRDTDSSLPPKVERLAIPACVHDILSALYYARSQTLVVGKSFDFPLNDGAKTIRIRVDVQAEEEVQTEIGKFPAIRVEPEVFSGRLFSGSGRLQLWLSKDSQHIPLLLRAQIEAGTITATLASIEKEIGVR